MANRSEGTGGTSGQSMARWAMLLVLGGAVALPYSRASGSAERGGQAARSSAAPSGSPGDSPSPSRSDDETAHTDAVTLLGDFIGVDVSESAMLNDAARMAVAIVADLEPAATIDELRAAVIDLKNSGDRAASGTVASKLRAIVKDARDRHLPAPPRPPIPTAAPVRATAGARASFESLLVEFLESDSVDVRAAAVRKRFADHRDDPIEVEFLIATVPDPIDSNARWTFDPIVTAIQQAAAASDYVLDRFYIPDWDPERDDTAAHVSAPKRTHERWPGVILFRHDRSPADAADRRRLLVASLVSETPTSGIHQDAFRRAVRIQDAWQRAGGRLEVRVMGPTFSGSVPSLKNALARLDPQPASIRIVSGAATSVDAAAIEKQKHPAISFKTTVLPDSFTTWATIRFVQMTDADLRSDRLALLREANTTYGLTVVTRRSATEGDEKKAAAPLGLRTVTNWTRHRDTHCPDYDSRCIFASAWMFPFPLHISRLRGAADDEARRAAAASGAGPRFQTLQLDQPGSATDQIPALSPPSTAASVELMLANIMDALDREHISTVGLLATDARDKLFLAEQLSRRGSGVRLFTLESDLSYVHPDYNRYMRGMIVASTYPLFAQTQRWYARWHAANAREESRTHNQLQFSMTNAEGVYNATIALLDYAPDGTAHSAAAPPPVDYPFEQADHAFYPQLWLGVTGADAIWPIDVVKPDFTTEEGRGMLQHLQPFKPFQADLRASDTADDDARDLGTDASAWSSVAFVALSVIALVHVALYWRPRIVPPHSAFCRFFSRSASTSRPRYLLIAFVTLLLAYGAMVFMLLVDGWQGFRFSVISISAFGCAIVAVTGLTITTVHLASQVLRTLGEFRLPKPDDLRSDKAAALGSAAAFVAAGTFALAFIYGAVYALGQFRWYNDGDRATATAYFHRVTHPGNGVSPLVPVEFLLIAIYVWAFAHLWRLTRVTPQRLSDTLELFDGLLTVTPSYGDARRSLTRFLEHPASNLRLELAAAVMFLVFSTTAITLGTTIVSPEPVAFTWSFNGWWVCVQVLLCLGLAETLTFWLRFRAVIRAVAHSPLLGAFERLSPTLLHDRWSPRPPYDDDLAQSARFGRQLGLQLTDLLHGSAWPSDKRALVRRLGVQPDAYDGLSSALIACAPPTADDSAAHALWTETTSWGTLAHATKAAADAVAAFWHERARANVLDDSDFDKGIGTITDDVQRWYLRAEEFIAMQFVLVVRELIARLATVFFYIILGVLLLVAAQQSFPFEPHQQLLGTAWIYVLLAVVLIFGVFAQMERDLLLSAIASTSAGKLSWDATMWSKVLFYGVIPLATIFAAQFPQIGATIADWLSPVQKAIP
ncbi:MAG TPA: hypothetical protein VNG89_04715 [Vicinamibacterales bacterium]|nr:hypothetical protein [Vicinamibacterales bacterium]